MTRAVPLLALLLACASCGGSEPPAEDLAGVYLLDRAAYAGQLFSARLARAAQGRSPSVAQRQRWSQEAERTAAEADLRLDLMGDGGFVVRYRFGSEEGRRRGAWRLDGHRLVLRTTHAPGGPLAQPTEVTAVPTDGDELHFPPSAEVPHPFVLRRRPSGG